MEWFRPRDWWDRLFAVGVIIKGLDGLVELAGGVMLLLLDPAKIHRFVIRMTQPELSEDPRDFIATHLLHAAGTLTGSAVIYAAVYLLAHGAVKVVLVAAVLMNRLWAYLWMIAVLLAFIAYQLYQLAVSPTAGLVALTVFDAAVVFLTWHEYGRQRQRQRA
ncbi:DUF2127 domain-containing protein [Arthrobacter sp. I2-34]|uniref:DUF2127 domain-containing protein n=1 Tax=Arthrobacter hankyongi TaxID=2904801 RepID=A0ABS9LDY0_9MICC|nr:DUF2127 domain-containing protein [Arthrobacter hankyongi]MCG2624659.1 DUF2127 domain-containing protein [Arthrobacter hankyongi]